jgi:hypothetical protein
MRALLALAMSAVLACSANDDIPAPIVSAVVPDHAPANSVVVVSGSYFCGRPRSAVEDPTCAVSGAVHFGAVPGTPSTYTDVSIMVEVPAGASGATDVTVTAAGRTSNAVAFTVD